MPTITEQWAGKFALINPLDNTALSVYPSREHRSFPHSMKVPGFGIIAPFKSAALDMMRAVDIYPLVDDVPAHDPGWQQPQRTSLQKNVNHFEQLYQMTTKSPRNVADAKRELVEVERNRLENDGFMFAGVPYDSNAESIQRITGAAVFGLVTDKLNDPALAAILSGMGVTIPASNGVDWTAGDNSIQTFNAIELLLFALTAAQYVEAVFIVSQTHKSSIETLYSNGATAQAIWNYDHTTGWPASAGLGGVQS